MDATHNDRMDKMVTVRIWGELRREGTPGTPPIKVQLDIKVREKEANEHAGTIKRIPLEVALSPKSAKVVEDGNDYILQFIFDGEPVEEKKRVHGGKLNAR
jgi:hypothetical protein